MEEVEEAEEVEEVEELEEMKMEARRDILAHRGSLSVRSRSSLCLFDSMRKWLETLENFRNEIQSFRT